MSGVNGMKGDEVLKRCENIFEVLSYCVGNSIFCNGRIY